MDFCASFCYFNRLFMAHIIADGNNGIILFMTANTKFSERFCKSIFLYHLSQIEEGWSDRGMKQNQFGRITFKELSGPRTLKWANLKNLWRRKCVRRAIFRTVEVRVEGGETRPTVSLCDLSGVILHQK